MRCPLSHKARALQILMNSKMVLSKMGPRKIKNIPPWSHPDALDLLLLLLLLLLLNVFNHVLIRGAKTT